jgi:acyl-CoA thioester hydrolase
VYCLILTLLDNIWKFFAPLSFPQVLELGLRVNKLGSSSVAYEVGVFQEGEDIPAAVGGYTHVFVDRISRKSTPMLDVTASGLVRLLLVTAKL